MLKTNKEKSIKSKFFKSLIIMGIINMLVFVVIVVFMFEKNNRSHFLKSIENTEGFYKSLVKNDIKMLSASLDLFSENNQFKKSFVENNRDNLEQMGADLFQNNRENYGITHFYYIDLEDKCFLRMHKPAFYGDTINRATFKNAKKNAAIFSGIEMGKTAYAIRVVKPYMDNDKLLGYIEFGEEIDHFDHIIKEETGNEIVVIGSKDAFDEEKYKDSRKQTNQRMNWDDMGKHIILSNTLGEDSAFISHFYKGETLESIDKATYLNRVDYKGKTYMRGVFPFYEVGGKKSGLVYVLNDVTEHMEQIRFMLILLGLMGAILFSIAFFVTLRFLQHGIVTPLMDLAEKADSVSLGKGLDEEIHSNRNDEIGNLIHSFERMRKSLHMSMERLKKESK